LGAKTSHLFGRQQRVLLSLTRLQGERVALSPSRATWIRAARPNRAPEGPPTGGRRAGRSQAPLHFKASRHGWTTNASFGRPIWSLLQPSVSRNFRPSAWRLQRASSLHWRPAKERATRRPEAPQCLGRECLLVVLASH